ncbi:MAG: hypothetical protein R3175_08245 [Marinobacter sp.]|nr:hypothetical protein [Marinobacter sp.]
MPRLVLRYAQPRDEPAARELLQDPEVMSKQQTGSGRRWNVPRAMR